MQFELISAYRPTGDQPVAIRELTDGILEGRRHQVLLGVTGSGKTYTVANVIQNVQRPTLVLSHNKTLAAQLYSEFKAFFPNNAVEYFVSYYDYYQPEAYLPVSDTYIEKDLAINDEIEKLRLSATSALLSGRKDVIVVSSVSCIYGIGNPEDFYSNTIRITKGEVIGRDRFLRHLVDSLYFRSEIDFVRGSFRVRGDTVDVFPAYQDTALKFEFFDEEIEAIASIDPYNGHIIENLQHAVIFPANIFVTTKARIQEAIVNIQDDLMLQVDYFKKIGKHQEARRLYERVNYDLEMIRELGHCSGIENYSRYFDGRETGKRPFCLLDYFPDDFIMVIDESHVTIPQVRAMYGGDRSRKENLVSYGFRLPSALDNRPLKFDEFEGLIGQAIYVSATPQDYELAKAEGIITEQLIRPTGLLDPEISVRPSLNQIDDLMNEIKKCTDKEERVLVTTLTKRMAEELTKFLTKYEVRCRYIHSDVDTLDRVTILEDLRKGLFDVLVGVNLLREGLDLPEVSLVAILDADKEGFLRNTRSLTQTAGRAARNVNGKVIMYADKLTDSMQRTINETNRRREKQIKYNTEHGITPQSIVKPTDSALAGISVDGAQPLYYRESSTPDLAADPVIQYMDKPALEKSIKNTKKKMEDAAAKLDFIAAATLRDELYALQKIMNEKFR
ncbi:MAG TPA: excinuclease ABC subunit UvrB [Bacteroidales bacterium]|nr:excinuclease ABC subunit UvrB [Bacteroidales bacterium]